ncbi:MAG: MotA/TolQ/ExbB proton channel family protein [Verrucomicrobiota bacterium]
MSAARDELLKLAQEGGFVFWGLLVLAFGIAYSLLSILRLMRFPNAPKAGPSSWYQLLSHKNLEPGDLEAVREWTETDGRVQEIEQHLFGILNRRIPFAFTLIGTAPLLGLLGTVSGMFATFRGMSLSAAQAPVDVISAGISEALITTQTGLVIGVPAFIVCSILKSRVNIQFAHFIRLVSASRTQVGRERQNSSGDPNLHPQSGKLSYSNA